MEECGLKIFVAEDNPIELGGFIAMLDELGYEVVGHANNGLDAVQQLQSLAAAPDLVLMDINLPKMDGLAATEAIGQFCSLPVVLVTGYKSMDVANRSQSRNIFGYVQKPVNAMELHTTLQIAYRRYCELGQVKEALGQSRQALSDRKLVERAKGVLMDQFGLGEAAAMQALQKKSRKANKKLAEAARDVIEGAKLL